ncbi:MAG TPA: hypothetical protein DCZ49_00885 [Hyphomonadaceae bacterium]|nr:hypothetical protein [Hyphomonadaceae bacterium]
MSETKTNAGRYFEDFRLGETIHHATPRTITSGDATLYLALTGSRFCLYCSDEVARSAGFPAAPVDPFLVFHILFGKTVPDISRNAVANLGYAEGQFLAPVFIGDTVSAQSEIIGLKPNSNGQTGVVYVRTTGFNQRKEIVLRYCRWVLVNRRAPGAPIAAGSVPNLADAVAAADLILPPQINFSSISNIDAGSTWRFGDYVVGERIDHVDGMTVEEAEHQIATRLYQNTARVHFDALAQRSSRFGKRLIYGGVAISLARALSFNGLEHAHWPLALNGGRHVNPLFAGDTLYAWTQVLDKADLGPAGALRLRTIATRDRPCADFPSQDDKGVYDSAIVLDLDYWVAIGK